MKIFSLKIFNLHSPCIKCLCFHECLVRGTEQFIHPCLNFMHSRWTYAMKALKTWYDQRQFSLRRRFTKIHQDYTLPTFLIKFQKGLWKFHFNLWISWLFWSIIGEPFPQKPFAVFPKLSDSWIPTHSLFLYMWICMEGCHKTDKDVASLLKLLTFLQKRVKPCFLLNVS